MHKRFFVRGIIFLAIGGIIWVGLSYISPLSSRLEYEVKTLLSEHKDVEAITVGHSHNRAIDFNVLGLNGYHVWSGGSGLFETEYLLRYLVLRLENLKTVFIPMAYWNFRRDNSLVDDRTRIRMRYYKAINEGPIDQTEWNLYLKAKTRVVMRADHWKDFIKIFLSGEDLSSFLRVSPDDGHRIQAEDYEQMTYQELVEQTVNGPGGVEHHLDLQKQMVENDSDIVEKTFKCAERTIEFLQSHNIRIIFFTPPYFVKYTELYDRETVKEMKSLMNRLVKKYSVEYYDFSTEENLITNNQIFANDDHLNVYGAKVFSELLRVKMKSHSK